jgi:hypothetical protein
MTSEAEQVFAWLDTPEGEYWHASNFRHTYEKNLFSLKNDVEFPDCDYGAGPIPGAWHWMPLHYNARVPPDKWRTELGSDEHKVFARERDGARHP